SQLRPQCGRNCTVRSSVWRYLNNLCLTKQRSRIHNVIAVLSESVNPRDYWFRMKVRVKIDDGLELSTICR
ncbi:MAG: hypothetical protein WCK85_07520, partial [Chlorobium sp.]